MKKIIFISVVVIIALLVFFIYLKPSKNNLKTDTDSSEISEAIYPDSLEALSEVEDTVADEETADTVSAEIVADSTGQKAQAQKNIPDTSKSEEETKSKLWPVKTPPLLPGALLPKHRIITFYGNLYSTRMGILGEYAPDVMLKKLKTRVAEWQAADSTTKALPALQLIVVTGQGSPGPSGLYRLRMPFWMVDSAIHMANSIDGIVILDFQVGQSTVEAEIPHYEQYLKMPNVHLAVDPEFYMKRGNKPGTRIGTMDATDINYCINYLKKLVEDNNLPPKLLVIHRFTQGMVTNYKDIKLQSQVQVIMDMDGFGAQFLKKDAYRRYIYREPVEYTGIKLFLKNDNANGHRMFTPAEVLQLAPKPLYVQYQ